MEESKIVAAPLTPPTPAGDGEAALPEHRRLVALYGGEYRLPRMSSLLDDLLAQLAPASDTPGAPYKVTILNSPVVNAFALPSGDIYVTRGLLTLAQDGSEVAAVMAHEIAHVSARHASARADLEKRGQVVKRVVSEVLAKPADGERFAEKSKLTLASFSRNQEIEADRIGVANVARAGFDPFGATRFLNALGRSTSLRAAALGQRGGDKADLTASHPSTPERVQAALRAARQYGAPGIGKTYRAEYLNALDGMIYGDDPSEGYARGRRFLHPKLGFSFEAPDGFVLENGPKALLGIAGGGAEALRLDSVRVSASTPLASYLSSGWIEGLETNSIETSQINGLPAATALARGQDWTFRLAAVRFGTDVYRMIFATRALTPQDDARFLASIRSFRRLSTGEAATARPLRLAVAAAESGAPESLAQRMQGVDRPLDMFLLLNGLDRGQSLTPGEKYKIVVE
ncbi:MAG: M48 family metalloprotease [Rhodoblastus sp.]|nr:MAG: M48 family metalloprotease [Rhodoblastus sp.]